MEDWSTLIDLQPLIVQSDHFNSTETSSESKLRMDFKTIGLINVPFALLSIMACAFFIFCMVRPLHGQRIKQPLKLLLWTLICCTMTFMMSALVVFYSMITLDFRALIGSNVVFICNLSPSMTSSVWLNFLYYTQIVPTQRALSVWIKKNIKPIIYCVWFVEKIISLFGMCLWLFDYLDSLHFGVDTFADNSTVNETLSVQKPSTESRIGMFAIAFFTFKAHFIVCLCVMVMSSGSTVAYLCKHMCRMAANGQPLTCPRVRSQVRVAITGLLQGVLYMFCSVWTVCNYFTEYIFTENNSGFTIIHFTVINLYMMCSMFNMGVGQGVFRQRASDIWFRVVQWCKASKVQQSEQEG